MSPDLINQLLWPFKQLPTQYLLIDTETTGLFDAEGAPALVSLGLVLMRQGDVQDSKEFLIRPHRQITTEASGINGISQEQAMGHPTFKEQWALIHPWIEGQLVVIHNAFFDWSLITDHIQRYDVGIPKVAGVFCSQRAAQPWAQSAGIACSERGPSLDALTKHLRIKSLRQANNNYHGALIDAQQTANVVRHLQAL
jgi:DNA polymerase-3 subunit epsilon